MDLRQLQYFVQIAKSGGFNRASEVLHIAQSALSRQMRQLEHELGVDLFERSARGVRLTPAGELMVERAEALLRQFRETKDQLLALAEVPRGRVAFGIPAILRDAFAAPLVERFNDLHPNVEITYVTGLSKELREWILEGKIDLGVFGLLEPETVLKAEPLLRDDIMAVGRSPTPFAGRATMSAREMMALPLVVSNREQLRLVLKRNGETGAAPLGHIPEINDSALLMNWVLSGKYYSILPRSMVAHHIEKGELFGAIVPGIQYQWVVGYAPERTLSAAARTIQRMLFEIGQQLEAANAGRQAPRRTN